MRQVFEISIRYVKSNTSRYLMAFIPLPKPLSIYLKLYLLDILDILDISRKSMT